MRPLQPSFLKTIFLTPVFLYQKFISPLFPASCRYTPTCSSYAIEAVNKYGILRGTKMAILRISRCHPCGNHGYDPVPKVIIKKIKFKKIIKKPVIFANEM